MESEQIGPPLLIRKLVSCALPKLHNGPAQITSRCFLVSSGRLAIHSHSRRSITCWLTWQPTPRCGSAEQYGLLGHGGGDLRFPHGQLSRAIARPTATVDAPAPRCRKSPYYGSMSPAGAESEQGNHILTPGKIRRRPGIITPYPGLSA